MQNTHIHICRCHSDTKSLAWVLGRLHIFIYCVCERPQFFQVTAKGGVDPRHIWGSRPQAPLTFWQPPLVSNVLAPNEANFPLSSKPPHIKYHKIDAQKGRTPVPRVHLVPSILQDLCIRLTFARPVRVSTTWMYKPDQTEKFEKASLKPGHFAASSHFVDGCF